MSKIIFVPIRDYFQSRKRILLKLIFPFSVGIISLIAALLFDFGNADDVNNIFTEFISVQINIVAILISFSVAIITILVSADNKSIEQLKDTPSTTCKTINGKTLSLFQVLLSNISYNAVVEIVYLIMLIGIVLIKSIITICILKYVVAVCIFIILHILLVLLESVAQMYLTFWNKKE